MSRQQLLCDTDTDEQNEELAPQNMGEDITYSFDDVVEHIGVGLFQIKVFVIAGLAWMADASEMMIISILSTILKCEWHLTPAEQVLITTVVFLGQGLGSFTWGLLGDNFGRKRGICASTLFLLIFGVACSAVPSYPWLLVCRFLVGFGVGGSAQAVVVIAEMFPIQNRGKAEVCLCFFWSIGSVFASILALVVIPTYSWRYFLLAASSPALLFLLAALWLPESPRYLYTKGKHDQLMENIKKMCRANGKTLPKGTLEKIGSEVDEQQGNFIKLFSSEWQRTTLLLALIWFTIAFGYYGVVFLTTSMSQTDINGCNPVPLPSLQHNSTNIMTRDVCQKLTTEDYTEFIWNTIAEFPGLVAAMILIDRTGRRWALVIQFTIGGIFFLSLAICTTKTASIVLLFIVRGAMAGGFQSVLVYTTEVLPTNIRAVGTGTCLMVSRLGVMLTPLAAQVLINESFYYVVTAYFVPMLVCMLSSLMLKVETQGKGLRDFLESN